MSIRLPVCFAIGATPLLALAQSAPPSSEIIVSASRLANSASTTPYSVSTIQQEQLAGRTDVADALSQLADIQVQSPGGRSGNNSIFLRGADPNFTAVLFEGVPLNNPTNSRGGAVNVTGIDASLLERIELVAGPLSSLYGSGSLAGVINLVAPAGTPTHQVRATLGAGTHDYLMGSLRWQGPITNDVGASFGVVSDDDGEQTPDARFRSRTVFGKIAALDNENAGHLVARINETETSAYPDASGGSRLATRRTLEERKGREQMLGVALPLFSGDMARTEFSASWLQRRDDTTSPGVARSAFDPVGVPAGTDSSRYRRLSGQIVERLNLSSWALGAGIEALRENGTSDGYLDFGFFRANNNFDLRRSTVSGFLEANLASDNLAVNTGLRVDDVEGLKTTATARAGLRYAIAATGFALRAAVGSGFKAPSFYALGNPFVGNAKLKPEHSTGGEVGVLWTGNPGDSFAITLFQTGFKDLIDFVPGPPPRLENRNLVTSKGIDLTMSHALSQTVNARLQTQYVRTRDDESHEQLLNRPEWRASVSLSWTVTAAVTLNAMYNHVGQRDDYATPVGVETLDAYDTVSVETSWLISNATTARLVLSNALNAHYEDAVGFASPGAAARLLFSHTF